MVLAPDVAHRLRAVPGENSGLHGSDQFNPKIKIFAWAGTVGQKTEVIPAATATFCEPLAL